MPLYPSLSSWPKLTRHFPSCFGTGQPLSFDWSGALSIAPVHDVAEDDEEEVEDWSDPYGLRGLAEQWRPPRIGAPRRNTVNPDDVKVDVAGA